MKTSIWFRTEEKQPDKSGYYLSYRGWGLAGKADSDHGYVYYDKKINQWRDYESTGHYAIVYYWTDAKPDEWTDNDPPSTKLHKVKEQQNVALESAYKDVLNAIDKYNLIRELVK